MKIIKTSTYNYPDIIANDFLYVDKTSTIWKLVKGVKDEFFLSRPRRFGKSLLISTLKAIFQGRRELFKGLAIDKVDYDWKPYPVIHLDFGNTGVDNVKELEEQIASMLANAADENNIQIRGTDIVIQFSNLIRDLAKREGREVVVLVDEYDKPILSNATNPKAASILKKLKRFYGVVKTSEGNIRFAFITGVSKFAHVSLFSDLNNLTDITLDANYAGLLGFSEAEIREYFADRIPLAAKANGVSEKELMSRLLKWYDGYRFSDAETHVCNPVSVSAFFAKNYKFSNYWDDTGTPEFLVKLAREKSYDYEAALNDWYDESVFSAYELDRLDVTGLLWQTGYLTIKEVRNSDWGSPYRLDFPDLEVRRTFMRRLLDSCTKDRKGVTTPFIEKLQNAVMDDDLEGFLKLFQSFLAGIDYDLHLPYEKYYQTMFFCVFKLLGVAIEAEAHTNEGRIDAYIRTEKKVYLFEFKLNKTSQKAIRQIAAHHYYEKFQASCLPMVMVGVNFDFDKGNIKDWKSKTIHN